MTPIISASILTEKLIIGGRFQVLPEVCRFYLSLAFGIPIIILTIFTILKGGIYCKGVMYYKGMRGAVLKRAVVRPKTR